MGLELVGDAWTHRRPFFIVLEEKWSNLGHEGLVLG